MSNSRSIRRRKPQRAASRVKSTRWHRVKRWLGVI